LPVYALTPLFNWGILGGNIMKNAIFGLAIAAAMTAATAGSAWAGWGCGYRFANLAPGNFGASLRIPQ
jgi:hypothetical protein